MELEFDKEINAILRKARNGTTSATPAGGAGHLDAESVSLFVENAIPAKTRTTYTAHFADCDRCRTVLANAIRLNDQPAEHEAVVVAPVAEKTVSWLEKIFRIPNLAMVMGALVITFGGIMGYVLFFNNAGSRNSDLAKVTEPKQPMAAAPANRSFESTVETNSNAASASNTTVNSPLPPEPMYGVATPPSGSGSGSLPTVANTVPETSKDEVNEKRPAQPPLISDDKAAAPGTTGGAQPPPEPNKTLSAAPKPMSTPADAAKSGIDRDRKDDSGSDMLALKKKESEDGRRAATGEEKMRQEREAPMSAAKSGPSRSGPLNTQNQINNQVFDMPVTRSVGGKSFNNRQGAWYDTAYRGQATTNVSRGSEEYRKLDGGLRSIAQNLGGVVVVVWKGKAYRIQ